MLKISFQVDALGSGRTVTGSPVEWALVVHQLLNHNGGNIAFFTYLASCYYPTLSSHARRHPRPVDSITDILFSQVGSGKKTPRDSVDPTQNLEPMEETDCEGFLQSATV
jgi:hypothetical protein